MQKISPELSQRCNLSELATTETELIAIAAAAIIGLIGEMELFRNRGPGFGRKIAGRGGKLLEISGWEPRFSLGFVSHCGRNHDWRNH